MATSDIKKGPLYVDSTNNRVGVGTASPATALDVAGSVNISNSSGATLKLTSTDTSGADTELLGQIDFVSSDVSSGSAGTQARIKGVYEDNGDSTGIAFLTGNSTGSGSPTINEVMRIRHEGNVGIGITSPSDILHIKDSSSTNVLIDAPTDNASLTLQCGSSDAGAESAFVQFIQNTTAKWQLGMNTDNTFRLYNYNTTSEALQVDPSGNLLVGKTASNVAAEGAEIRPSGFTGLTVDGGAGLTIRRLTSDGELQSFFKDTTKVGSIGAKFSGRCYIASGSSSNTGLRFDTNFVAPSDYTGAGRDNAIDLGSSGARFDDVFATNGTIQTSDANEKQQIAALTDAEMTAAKAISQLFKTFKWNDSVAEKGDAARTHTGVIAQDVQAAMSAAGLSAANYAFWCSDTWWETQTEVPAVEADEENDIEAVAAYTRTDTFKTAEEAPEGATERTRLGIRYPELLAFIGAATEQRLSNIETRLAALEAN